MCTCICMYIYIHRERERDQRLSFFKAMCSANDDRLCLKDAMLYSPKTCETWMPHVLGPAQRSRFQTSSSLGLDPGRDPAALLLGSGRCYSECVVRGPHMQKFFKFVNLEFLQPSELLHQHAMSTTRMQTFVVTPEAGSWLVAHCPWTLEAFHLGHATQALLCLLMLNLLRQG